MQGLSNEACDEVTLRLSGLIAVFDMLVNVTSGERSHEHATILDFSYYISKELQGLYKTVSGIEYNS